MDKPLVTGVRPKTTHAIYNRGHILYEKPKP